MAQLVRTFSWYLKGPRFKGSVCQVQIFSVQFLLRARGSLAQTQAMTNFPGIQLFSAFEGNLSLCTAFRIGNVEFEINRGTYQNTFQTFGQEGSLHLNQRYICREGKRWQK